MDIPATSRQQVLAFRQRSLYLHQRLPRSRLVEAAFAGLQDSSPRSAILALHARVHDVMPTDWEDHQLVQVWGPRGSDYVVPKKDMAVFTIGRMPRERSHRDEIENAVEKVARVLRRGSAERRETLYRTREFAHDLRLASISGRILIRWDASRISWRTVDPPSCDVEEVRLELARRFLRSLAPAAPPGFARWAGVARSDAQHTFASLETELSEVRLAGRPSWALKDDISDLERPLSTDSVRLLPAGDPYLWTGDRDLLVPRSRLRTLLWPNSVWPGALLIHGELVGTWRRQHGKVIIHRWRRISMEEKEAVKREVDTLPVDATTKSVRWEPST